MYRGDIMKKLILILCAVTMIGFTPLMASETKSPNPDTLYPEYTGSLDDPDLLVVYSGPGYIIVQRNGKTYVYYL